MRTRGRLFRQCIPSRPSGVVQASSLPVDEQALVFPDPLHFPAAFPAGDDLSRAWRAVPAEGERTSVEKDMTAGPGLVGEEVCHFQVAERTIRIVHFTAKFAEVEQGHH